ncbi:MAG: ABC transporter substrate-binding protein [Planctomycetota bacterium]
MTFLGPVLTSTLLFGLVAWGVGGHRLTPPGLRTVGWVDNTPMLPGVPSRIASATLASDEMIIALSGAAPLQAVTKIADDPRISNITREVKGIPYRIDGLDPEKILAMGPDLTVVARYTRRDAVLQLEESGLTVLRSPAVEDVEDVKKNALLLGRIMDAGPGAETMVGEMDALLEDVRRRVRGRPRLRVLYYTNGGYTAGKGSIFSQLLEVAGGLNTSEEAGVVGHGTLTQEVALTLDPDVIFVSGYKSSAKVRDMPAAEELAQDPAWAHVRAVQAGRVYTLPGNHLICISHHLVKAAEDMARVLHPECYE